MTLSEMSLSYRDSAEVLRLRLIELRLARRQCRTRKQIRALDARIRALSPLLRQCRELAALTQHYYERSCPRNERYCV